MKHVRIIANWLFIIVVYPLFIPIIFLMLVANSIICGWRNFQKDFVREFSDFKNDCLSKNFFKGREPWLKDGTHWPMQRVKPTVKNRSADKPPKGHPSNNT